VQGRRGRRRRTTKTAWLAIAIGTSALSILVISCSDDKPPGSSGSTTGLPQTEGGASSSGSLSDGGLSDGAQRDGEPNIPIDDASILPCLDDNAVTIDGGAGPMACPSPASCTANCASIKDHYKLGIAQTAIDCISKLANCTNQGQVRNCVDRALGRACKDTSSAGYCTPLVTSCDPMAGQPGSNIDQEGCMRFANGLTASGRSAFSACIQSKVSAGTCPTEVITCANQIRQ
jgi:hypothetical protein